MWAWLSLLLTLCLLHGGGAESDGGGSRCQLPPAWTIGDVQPMAGAMGQVTVVALLQASCLFCLVQASRLDPLRQKLENQGLKGVVYMVVNQQGAQAQQLHPMLAQRLSENITLYKQDEQQSNVWTMLSGQKDDFLIYDRCGRLTHHISLPYSIIGQGYVESAIREAYCKRICGDCTHESVETPDECTERAHAQPGADGAPAVEEDTRRGHSQDQDHGHGHHHAHHHGHGHGHHGDNTDYNPGGVGHDHNNGHHRRHGHGHGHNHGQSQSQSQSHPGFSHQGHEQDDGMSQRQLQLDLSQMQQVVSEHEILQQAPARP